MPWLLVALTSTPSDSSLTSEAGGEGRRAHSSMGESDEDSEPDMDEAEPSDIVLAKLSWAEAIGWRRSGRFASGSCAWAGARRRCRRYVGACGRKRGLLAGRELARSPPPAR